MKKLLHNESGFLIGEPLQVKEPRTENLLGDLLAETIEIRRALTADSSRLRGKIQTHTRTQQFAAQGMQHNTAAARNAPVQSVHLSRRAEALLTERPAERLNYAEPKKPLRVISEPPPERINQAKREASEAQKSPAISPPVQSPRQRDASGRFARHDEAIPPTNTSVESSFFRRFASKLAGAVRDTDRGLEEVDPAIQAFNEVATPLGKSMEWLGLGGENKEAKQGNRWLKRFFSSFSDFRQENSVFNKAANKHLKNIEEKPPQDSSGGNVLKTLAFLPSLLGKAFKGKVGGFASKGLGALGAALGVGVLAGKLKNLSKGASAAGQAAGVLSKSAAFLKRIPILGAALGALGLVSDLKQGEKTRGEAVGGFGGSLAGGLAGAKMGAAAGAILGPLGAAIGGVVGAFSGAFFGEKAGGILGEKFGEWIEGLKNSDLIGSVLKSWNSFVEKLKSLIPESAKNVAKPIFNKAASFTQKAKNGATRAWDWTREKLGFSTQKSAATPPPSQTGSVPTPSLASAAPPPLPPMTAPKQDKNSQVVTQRWNANKGYLIEAAGKTGVNPATLAKIAHFESKFNDNARPYKVENGKKVYLSSAHGFGQFIDGTWLATLRKHGEKHGIKNAKKLTKQEAAHYRNDKALQAAMLAEFTNDNINLTKKYGSTGNQDVDVYAYHNLGEGSAKRLINAYKTNPNASISSVLSRQEIENNPSLYAHTKKVGKKSVVTGYLSVAESIRRIQRHMDSGAAYAADAEKIAAARAQQPREKPPVIPPAIPQKAVNVNTPPTAASAAKITPPTATQQANSLGEAPPVSIGAWPLKPQNAAQSAPRDVGQNVPDRQIAHIVSGGILAR